jgi:glycosyltransferase involved in cell wall biosynthesis
MTISTTHLVLLPTYNTGPRLRAVVGSVLQQWRPVLVVVDGSTDGSEAPLAELAAAEPALTVLRLTCNAGKGAAVLAGAEAALARGFSHALVMDADGQHPAESIGEFMAASQRHPERMILGRPRFPANIPAERLHGRKLSVGLVRLELFGGGVADPLFGFRVYPLAPLLAALGPRRGGRRYDFDTEAVVRLCWAGIVPCNLSAPVRYFSRAEGGVSHFHYLRDNLTLTGMHLRLLAELLLWRWPDAWRHRRRWRALGLALLLVACLPSLPAQDAGGGSAETPLYQVSHDAPAWRELAAAFARRPDLLAPFVEERHFPFRRKPVELHGEVRVSRSRGLSLHYASPAERIVIFDEQGMLVRESDKGKGPPIDARAAAAQIMLPILRMDLEALAREFDLDGSQTDTAWTLRLSPRTESLQRSVGRVTIVGEQAAIREIELRVSDRQFIRITMGTAHSDAPFTDEEMLRFFR